MAVYTIGTPDGRKLRIEAPDEATALRGAQEWSAQNATAAQPPAGAKPGTREYADWAAQRARSQVAGGERPSLPQVGQHQTTQSNILDPLAQGMTFGWGDEMASAMHGIGAMAQGGDFGSTYAQAKDHYDNSLERERRVNPGGALAAEIAGGLVPAVASAPFAAPLVGMGNAGRTLPMWQQMFRGGMLAAPGGAVYGAGAGGNTAQERGLGALTGMAAGAVGGAIAPPVFRAAGAAAKNVGNRLSANAAANRVGVSPQAARFAAETLGADDTLNTGMARMMAAGDERMIADAGQSATNLLDYAIQSSGRAGRLATDAIEGRVSRDAQAIQDALDGALGRPTGIQTARAGIRDSTEAARSAAYDGAYSSPIDYASPQGRKLEELLKRVDQSDLNAANALMRAEGYQSRQIMAKIADDGTVTYQRMPDVRQIDYLTRALNDRSQANAGLGAMGGQTNAGRIYGNLSGDIRDATKKAVDPYRVALETAADPIRRSQAIEFGSTVLRPSVTRDEVANMVLRMTGPEREAVQQGIRAQIDDVLANVTRTVMDGDVPAREAIAALRQLSSRSAREKLTVILGKEKADVLFKRLDRAAQSFDLRANVATNTKTFQRQEMGRRLQQTTAPDGPISTIMRGEPLNAGKRAIQLMSGQTPENALRQQDEIMSEIVQLLTARGMAADDVLSVLRALGSNLNSQQGIADAARILGERAALPVGVGTEQLRMNAMR